MLAWLHTHCHVQTNTQSELLGLTSASRHGLKHCATARAARKNSGLMLHLAPASPSRRRHTWPTDIPPRLPRPAPLPAGASRRATDRRSTASMREGSVSVTAARTAARALRCHCYVKTHGSEGPSAALGWGCWTVTGRSAGAATRASAADGGSAQALAAGWGWGACMPRGHEESRHSVGVAAIRDKRRSTQAWAETRAPCRTKGWRWGLQGGSGS
jgi:hypothetical protein